MAERSHPGLARRRVRAQRLAPSGRAFWPDVVRRRLLALADLAAGVAGAAAVGWLGDGTDAFAALACVPVWLLLAKVHGLYDADHRTLRHLTVDELPALAAWGATATGALALVTIAVEPVTVAASWLVVLWATLAGAAFSFRAVARLVWRRLVPRARVLVVGAGALASGTCRKVELFPDMHAEVARVLPRLDPADAHQALDGIDRVIVATEVLDEGLVERLVATCREANAKLSIVPPIRGMYGTAVSLARVGELPVVELSTWHVSRSTLLLKRIVDTALAAAVLVLAAPLFAAVAIAVRAADGPPVLFRQRRVGYRGRPFTMLKFRTLAPGDAEGGDGVSKPREHPRATRVGRALRRTSLDELPQVVNVLRGEMSLVGPRPAVLQDALPEARVLLEVRPGMTGPMQVYGRGELTVEERLAVERDYVENLSLGRDLRILALTLAAIAGGRGAY